MPLVACFVLLTLQLDAADHHEDGHLSQTGVNTSEEDMEASVGWKMLTFVSAGTGLYIWIVQDRLRGIHGSGRWSLPGRAAPSRGPLAWVWAVGGRIWCCLSQPEI